jgi:anti-anti-sigma factor
MSLTAAEVCPVHPMLSPGLVSALGDAQSTLRATTRPSGSGLIIYASGDVDACNEHIWRRLLSEATAVVTPPGPLVVDVNCLAFMGCCAFAALAEEADRCRRRGAEMYLVSRQRLVARIVGACGISGVLAVHPSVDSALAAAAGSADW